MKATATMQQPQTWHQAHQPQAAPAAASGQDPVNNVLRPKRPKRQKDNAEYQGMMRRMIRAYAKRVVAEDPSTLREMMDMRAELDEAINRAARRLHDDMDYSWGVIGQEVGMTRQGAYLRWGARHDADGKPVRTDG